MRYPLFNLAVCGLAFALLPADVSLAQSSSLFGSSGPQSQSTLGGVRSGTQSGATAQQAGTAGAGSAFLPAEGLVNTTSPTGQTGGFVGRNTDGGFVGQQQATQQFGQAGRTGLNSFNNQFNRGNAAGQQQFRNTNTGTTGSNPPQVRYQQRIAFPYPSIAAPQVTSSLQGRFERLAERNTELAGLEIASAADGTVVLTGVVLDERTRKLAESLTRLEPGVRRVDNQLQVVSP